MGVKTWLEIDSCKLATAAFCLVVPPVLLDAFWAWKVENKKKELLQSHVSDEKDLQIY